MRLTLLFLFLLPNFLGAQEHPCPDALFRYWEFKDRLHKHFVRLDWWGDGIGEWDNEKLQFEKAGYSLPASSSVVQPSACNYWEYWLYHCYQPADMLTNCSNANVLRWGDATVDLGYYFAQLATEYELLFRNGQTGQLQKTKHELWLALQAYRRLDIAANLQYDAWVRQNDPDCQFTQTLGMCGYLVNGPDLSGYSGFFMRDDVPNSIRHFFHANANADRAWEVGGIRTDHSCIEDDPLGNFLPFPDSIGGNNFLSQDQMIGILFGLAFIKKFIPAEETMFGDSLVQMAGRMAKGMLNHIQPADETIGHYRSIRYPGCLSEVPTEAGNNASNFFYGINLAIASISDDARVCTDGVDKQKWDAFAKRACDCDAPFYENCGFNCRMFLELLAITDQGNFKKTQDQALRIKKEGLVLARYLLQTGSHDLLDIKRSVFLTFENLLCENPPSCHGPCYRAFEDNEPFFECPNQPGWCAGNRLKIAGYERADCQYDGNWNIRGNGIDYLLLHNLYLLTYFPEAPFFNPENPEGEVAFRLPSVFEGERSVCPAGKTELAMPEHLLPFESVRWKASPNLELALLDASQSRVEISAKNENDTLGWVHVKVLRNGCERTYSWSKIRIGLPPVPLLEDRSEGCRHAVGLANAHADLFEVGWEMSGMQPADFSMENHGTSASLEFFTPPPVVADVAVTLGNACGTTSANQRFTFECDLALPKSLEVFPNPASDLLHLEFSNLSPHILHARPATIRIYDRLSRYLLAETTDRTAATVDISGLRSGMYLVQVVVGGEVFAARFVKN